MVIRNSSDIDAIKDFISKNDKVAFDIETTGLQPRLDKVIGFGVSNEQEGFYIVHLEWNGQELVEKVPFADCIEVIRMLETKKWVGWNSSFEVRFIRHYFGVDLASSLHSEGMLSVHTVDENRMSYKLKDLGAEIFGEEAKDEQRLMKESIKANGGDPAKDYYMADADLMGKYCINDCLLTYKIDKMYLEDISKEGLYNFYFKDEVMPFYKSTIINMEDNGINVDIKKLAQYSEEIKESIDTLHKKIQESIKPYLEPFTEWYLNKEFPPRRSGEFAQYICKYAELPLSLTKSGRYSLSAKNLEGLPDSIYKTFLSGGDYLPEEVVNDIQKLWWSDQGQKYIFNISSKAHLKKLFFETLNETPVSKTAKGNPQVDHLFLMEAAKKYEWVGDLIVYNKLNKLLGTYYSNYLQNNLNGVFFPGWFMHRTTSGRLGGNLMQLPRQLEEGSAHPLIVKYTNAIRDCIIAGDGYKLVGADYSSLEVVVFADDAGDESLLEMIRNNEDFYSKVCIDVFGLGDKYSANKKADNFFKKLEPGMRQDAKVYSLGLRYNMQAFKLSKTLNIDQKEAEGIIRKYFASYPKLKTRMDELVSFAKTHGYVKSKAGRIRHLSLLKKLHYSYGDVLSDSLELWKKYHDLPKKYQQMKYLSKQYKSAINNCLNFPIQSMAASITNRACIALSREFKRKGLKATICMQVHDEIVVRCPNHEVEQVKLLMKFLMENVTKLSVPLNADPEVGDRYGEIK